MEQQPRLPLWFLIVNCGLIATAFIAGAMLGGRQQMDLPQPQADAFEVIYREILRSHVEPQDGHVLLDRAITAMAGKLDDYSRYVPPGEVANYEENTTGRYQGVGMVMRQHGDDVVVHFPFANSPAELAGIRPGDRLITIDGVRVADLDSKRRNAEASKLLRGPADTVVELRLDRDGESIQTRVERTTVQKPAVKWAHMARPDGGLGYLHVTDFNRGVAEEVRRAIAALQDNGPLRGLVIDLRWNGGGNLDECIAMARTFQPTGVIVSTRRRGSEIERVEAVADECVHADLPLVLLVNADSASASEVLAGCLQDHDRATVVGVRTYGKGVVNTVYSWPDFKLKLTTAHYYTPNGRSLGGSHRNHDSNGDTPQIGIQPDIELPVSDEERQAILHVLIQHEVPAAHRESFAVAAKRYGIPVPTPPRAENDTQLSAALEELHKRVIATKGK